MTDLHKNVQFFMDYLKGNNTTPGCVELDLIESTRYTRMTYYIRTPSFTIKIRDGHLWGYDIEIFDTTSPNKTTEICVPRKLNKEIIKYFKRKLKLKEHIYKQSFDNLCEFLKYK